MTFREAMQAMLDGKKVRNTAWAKKCFVFFKGNKIIDELNDNFSFSGDQENEEFEIFKEERTWNLWYHEGMNAFSTVNPGDTPEKWQQIKVKEII